MKLAIRSDKKADLIRAYFSTTDDSDRFEVATLKMSLAQKCPDLFEVWKSALAAALAVSLEEATGGVVTGFEEFRPHNKN